MTHWWRRRRWWWRRWQWWWPLENNMLAISPMREMNDHSDDGETREDSGAQRTDSPGAPPWWQRSPTMHSEDNVLISWHKNWHPCVISQPNAPPCEWMMKTEFKTKFAGKIEWKCTTLRGREKEEPCQHTHKAAGSAAPTRVSNTPKCVQGIYNKLSSQLKVQYIYLVL